MAKARTDRTTATVAERLRMGGGFHARERDHIVETLRPLDERLKTFPSEAVDLELSVKERETASQRTVLECWIVHWPRLVATSTQPDLDAAVMECRDDLRRQINDAKTKMEPRNNRRRRTNNRREGGTR